MSPLALPSTPAPLTDSSDARLVVQVQLQWVKDGMLVRRLAHWMSMSANKRSERNTGLLLFRRAALRSRSYARADQPGMSPLPSAPK